MGQLRHFFEQLGDGGYKRGGGVSLLDSLYRKFIPCDYGVTEMRKHIPKQTRGRILARCYKALTGMVTAHAVALKHHERELAALAAEVETLKRAVLPAPKPRPKPLTKTAISRQLTKLEVPHDADKMKKAELLALLASAKKEKAGK